MLTEIASFEKIRSTIKDPIWVKLENAMSYFIFVVPHKSIINGVADVANNVRGMINNQIGRDLKC